MLNILKQLKLEQYIEIFNNEGIDNIEDFNDYEDEDLIDIGLKKPHIKRLRRYFEENSSSENKEVEIKQEWHQTLYNNTDIWNDELLDSNIPIISHEYKRIQDLLSQGQYFGVLLQIKDFLEILLKLPVLIILNEKFNTQCESNKIKAFILSSLEKPLSLGHWHELATDIKKNNLIEDENFKKLINNIVKLYNKNNITKWRNDEIGHGALSLDDDKEFQKDIEDKLKLIKKFLDDNVDILKNISIDRNDSTISYRNNKFSSYPFFHIDEDKIYFFDSYLSRKEKTHQLNYCYGKKKISTINDFNSFITQNEANKRDDKLSNSNITDIRLAEDENKLDNLESNNDFIEPEYLINWLKDTMDNCKKGKLLLQMQRGTGKSLFCKALDQLSLNKINLDDDMLVRAYYINDMYRNSLSDFSTEISHFILNKEIQLNTLVDKFKGNLPTLTTDSTKEDFAYMLSWYKKHYDVEKLLFIIDAVDEIPQSKEKSIFDILPDNEQLEDGIFILITSRIYDEIIEYTHDNIKNLDYIATKSVSKESDDNLSILKSYITKYALAKNDSQIEQLVSKSDYRILYLNMLKEIILSSNIDINNIPEQEAIIDYYLDNIKNKYGEKYYSNIFKILIILASQLEELTIKEISLLNNDAMLNLKLIANMFDLRGFIKKTRDTNGNKFSLSHISLVKYLNDKYKNEIISYLYEIYSDIESFNPEDEADIYKMAYLQMYENIYGITLNNNLKSDIVLSFLLHLNKCDIHKKIKIVMLLYTLDINAFFKIIRKMETQNELELLFQIIEKLKSFGDTKNTIKCVEMVINKFDNKSKEYLILYETMCDMIHLEGRYEETVELLEKLVIMIEKLYGKNSSLYIRYSIRIIHNLKFYSSVNVSWNKLYKLKNEIDKNKFPKYFTEILFMLGGSISVQKGNYKEGMKYLQQTVEIAEKNDNYLLSRCMRRLSDYSRFDNKINEAEGYCSKGIEYASDDVINRQRIYLYATQAENLRKQHKYNEAIEYFQSCIKLSKERNIKGWIANAFLGIGEVYRLKQDNEKANYYLQEALNIYKKINANYGVVHSMISISLLNNIDKVILKNALKIAYKYEYEKEIGYIREILEFNTIDKINSKLYYHDLMFL